MYTKISFKQLQETIATHTAHGFECPYHYRLSFPVVQICKCCKKLFFTRKIHLFKDNQSTKIVCNCTKCGGRHTITVKNIKETIISYCVMGGCLALLLLILFA